MIISLRTKGKYIQLKQNFYFAAVCGRNKRASAKRAIMRGKNLRKKTDLNIFGSQSYNNIQMQLDNFQDGILMV